VVPHAAESAPASAPAGLAHMQSVGGGQAGGPPCAEGQRRLHQVLDQSQATFPEACRCLEEEAEARLNPRKVPARHRQYVRTSNLAARAFEAERRRTKVIPPLWEAASFVKLVFAVLLRVSERWGKKQCSAFEQRPMRALRQTLGLDHPLGPLNVDTRDRSPRRSAASAG